MPQLPITANAKIRKPATALLAIAFLLKRMMDPTLSVGGPAALIPAALCASLRLAKVRAPPLVSCKAQQLGKTALAIPIELSSPNG